LGDLETKLNAKDWVGAARVCHDLKGTAGGYGYPDIGQAVQQLEAEIKGEKDILKVEPLFDSVRTLCARARLALDPALLH
jgi:HPt (histidine-containing phosphotransfer) domain-containing protein